METKDYYSLVSSTQIVHVSVLFNSDNIMIWFNLYDNEHNVGLYYTLYNHCSFIIIYTESITEDNII